MLFIEYNTFDNSNLKDGLILFILNKIFSKRIDIFCFYNSKTYLE
jgi:hypothetical protein